MSTPQDEAEPFDPTDTWTLEATVVNLSQCYAKPPELMSPPPELPVPQNNTDSDYSKRTDDSSVMDCLSEGAVALELVQRMQHDASPSFHHRKSAEGGHETRATSQIAVLHQLEERLHYPLSEPFPPSLCTLPFCRSPNGTPTHARSALRFQDYRRRPSTAISRRGPVPEDMAWPVQRWRRLEAKADRCHPHKGKAHQFPTRTRRVVWHQGCHHALRFLHRLPMFSRPVAFRPL